ncbi:MAG: UDP-N-acetylglucosamine 4,6-dehydratase (inverting) [Deferribacteres bacterium]|nr:UDP-N-acetylglucosamine 4,6-dehydratase (inverting) [Deferribacteres bacterium]
MLDDKVILITGGTGSFGKAFIKRAFEKYNPRKIIVFSRDEYKQYKLSLQFPQGEYPIRYFIGDIRDKDRLKRAFTDVDYVIHTAALKHVPIAEYNPFEAVKTNILGAENIVDAALDTGVKKVVALSTDKAVNPINLYGATKLAMEKIFIAANAYAGAKETGFSVVRYGNVMGSRGSVIQRFLKLKREGVKEFPITDERMTRFWITLEEAVDLVIFALKEAVGGEVFVPRIPSMKITDLARAIEPECTFRFIGIRPGEKLHETLISEEEGRSTIEIPYNGRNLFVILPHFPFKPLHEKYGRADLKRYDRFWSYRSDTNDWWLTVEELRDLISRIPLEED